MKRLLISTIASGLLVGSSFIACQSKPAVTTSDKTPKVKTEKQPEQSTSTQAEKMKELINEFNKLNNTALEHLQSKNYNKALKIFQELDNLFPGNLVVLYNLTCTYSLMDDKQSAIVYLRKAIQCGWNDWEHMDEDTDLNNIKNESDYKQLRDALEIIFPEGKPFPGKE